MNKKLISLVCCLLLCVSLVTPAFGDIDAQEIAEECENVCTVTRPDADAEDIETAETELDACISFDEGDNADAEKPDDADALEDEDEADKEKLLSHRPDSTEGIKTADSENYAYNRGAFDVVVPGASLQADYSAAEAYIVQEVLAGSEEIDVYDFQIPLNVINSLVNGISNEYPELYFVWYWSYSFYDDVISTIRPVYDDYPYDHAAFDYAVNRALSCIKPGMSEVEKAIALHEYIIANCAYDYENYLNGGIPTTSYNAYGVLVLGSAVCQGYAETYKLLLNKLGIDCYMVSSSAMNHAWNVIKLGGSYYQVDVTWDDPVWDFYGMSFHNNMFLSDSSFSSNHYSWVITKGTSSVSLPVNDTRYDNAFWRDDQGYVRTPLVYVDGNWYFGTRGVLRQGNIFTGDGNYIADGLSSCSGLFYLNGKLYYNDSYGIYSYDLSNGDEELVFEADTSRGYIYGCGERNGTIYYARRFDFQPDVYTYRPVSTGISPQPQRIKGDINDDSVVNTKDAVLLLKYVMGESVSVNDANLDTNGDGKVNLKDAVLLLKYITGEYVSIY